MIVWRIIEENVVRLNRVIMGTLVIVCLLPTLILTGYKMSVKANTRQIHVPSEQPTIQDAVNNATDGDVIVVASGIYYEHVVINKSVSLIGEGTSTIVDGNGTGTVISIRANNVSIEGFTVLGSGSAISDSGIHIGSSSSSTICHNTVADNNIGIGFQFSNNNLIVDNNISNNRRDGVYFDQSDNNLIIDNNISNNNNHGVNFDYSGNNLMIDNNISNNNNNGVNLYYSGNNLIIDNNISNNKYDGVRLHYSSDSTISYNTISSNNYGTRLAYSRRNQIYGNSIFSNDFFGIYVALYSDTNTIYRNNFNNSYEEVFIPTDLENFWDNGFEGNYWTNYNGTDSDRDGIGETPHALNANNTDRYPLMGIFSHFNVELVEETHRVTTISNSTLSDFRFEIGLETGNKMIRFKAAGGVGTSGFCRVVIPADLMNGPYITIVGTQEIMPTLLNVSNDTHTCLYFTYIHSDQIVTIISSKALLLYNELLNKHVELQTDFLNLNATYYGLLNMYNILLGNYSQFQETYRELNLSYYEHLSKYSQSAENIQSLVYIFAATTAIFMIATIYLSKHAHTGKTEVSEGRE